MEECNLRHPALVKVMSVALAVLCIVMIGFGITKINDASENREKSLKAAENLAAKCDKYIEIDREFAADPLNYEAAAAELDKLLEQYEKDNAEHKAKLAEFSATKGGTTMGSLALDEAAVALKAGKKQYEDSVAELTKQLGEFSYILQNPPSAEQMQFMAMAVEAAKVQADKWNEKLTELQNKQEELYEQGIHEEALAELRVLITSLGEEKVQLEDEEAKLQTLYDNSKAQFEEAKEAVTAYIAEQTGLSEEEKAAAAEAYIVQLTGKTAEEWETEVAGYETELQGIKDEISELTERLGETTERADEMEAALDEIQKSLDTVKIGYDAAAAEYSKAKDLYEKLSMAVQAIQMLNEAKRAIQVSEVEIGNAWYTLKQTREGFDETHDELLSDKLQLENEQAAIREMENKIDSYNDISNRWKRARTALLLYPDIKSRVDAGEEITESAQTVKAAMENSAEREYKGRRTIAILCIVSGMFGLMTLPAAFEKIRTYPGIMIFTVLCLLCAAGAESIGLYMDWGQTYAALAGALFALLLIPAALPEKKRGA